MKLLKNKRALSTVVTTLIILVVSVLLATVVTMYSINVTVTRVEEENLHLSKPHIWYNTTGSWAEGAIVLINTGGKDMVLDKITIRGQEAAWTDVWFWRDNTVVVSADLNCTTETLATLAGDLENDTTFTYTSDTFENADDDITLKSGYTMVIYMANPDSIGLNDVGTTVGITIFSANAQYYKEVNVEAAQ